MNYHPFFKREGADLMLYGTGHRQRRLEKQRVRQLRPANLSKFFCCLGRFHEGKDDPLVVLDVIAGEHPTLAVF